MRKKAAAAPTQPPAAAASKAKGKAAAAAAPPPSSKPASKKAATAGQASSKRAAQETAHVAAPWHAAAVPDEPLPPALPAVPPPPPPDPRLVQAEAAISALFTSQRCEDLPLEDVRAAAGLPHDELDALLDRMDKENKLMVRAGSVYLI